MEHSFIIWDVIAYNFMQYVFKGKKFIFALLSQLNGSKKQMFKCEFYKMFGISDLHLSTKFKDIFLNVLFSLCYQKFLNSYCYHLLVLKLRHLMLGILS